LNQATLLGRIHSIRNSWNDELKKEFKKILNDVEMRRVESEFKMVDEQLRNVIPELQGTLNTELRSSVFNYSFILFTPESFPATTWQKCGYITFGINSLLDELQHEIPEKLEIERKDDVGHFEKEYARASLMSYSSLEFEKIWSEWKKAQDNRYPRYPSEMWSEDELVDLLRKIDFNFKGFSKALVRVAGIAVCLEKWLASSL
jgi:hypothetical protein